MSRFLVQIRVLLLPALLLAASWSYAGSVPDFTLNNTSGDPVSLHDQRGKVVMLNFWAAWCAPCRKEMPLLDQLYQDLKEEGFELLAINTESQTGEAEDLLADLKLSFPVLWDKQGEVVKLLGVNAMPTTLVIDRQGELRFSNRGFRAGDEKKYREQVQELLAALDGEPVVSKTLPQSDAP